MGYYSDVRISTTREGFEFLKEHTDDTYELFGGYGYVEQINDDYGVVFGWDFVKWYEDNDDVSNFMTALNDAEDAGIPYEYVQVGEDNWSESHETHSRYNGESPLKHHIEAYMTINVYED